MRQILLTLLFAASLSGSGCSRPGPAAPQTEEQKTIYALGLKMGRHLAYLKLTPAEQQLLTRGVADALSGRKTDIDPGAYQVKIRALADQRAPGRAAAPAARPGEAMASGR